MSENQDSTPHILIDMGRVRRKRIKQLKQGEGPLIDEVQDAVEALKKQLGDELSDAKVVPVILVYKEKKKRDRYGIFGILDDITD